MSYGQKLVHRVSTILFYLICVANQFWKPKRSFKDILSKLLYADSDLHVLLSIQLRFKKKLNSNNYLFKTTNSPC